MDLQSCIQRKSNDIYDAAQEYIKSNIDTVIIAGKEYGTGSSRDWAAKGTRLLGVRAVIAESFERIHRSNLIGMGVLPLQFIEGINRQNLKLIGSEIISAIDLQKGVDPKDLVEIEIKYASGDIKKIKPNVELILRMNLSIIKTVEYYNMY